MNQTLPPRVGLNSLVLLLGCFPNQSLRTQCALVFKYNRGKDRGVNDFSKGTGGKGNSTLSKISIMFTDSIFYVDKFN